MQTLTLDDALAIVAERSFDSPDTRIVPITGNDDATGEPYGYLVEDDWQHITDDWSWTYDGGIDHPERVSEVSRLFDPAEFWDDARHVRYSMAESIDALERGIPVTFAYATVTDDDVIIDDDGNPRDSDDGELLADNLAGWIAVSIVWED